MSAPHARPQALPALNALYGLSGMAGFGLGLFGTLIAALLHDAGWREVEVGRNASLFFLCVIVAAPLAGKLVRWRSARFVLGLGLGLTALSALLFPLTEGDAAWTGLRAMMGLGQGLYMVAGQTLLNSLVDDTRRGAANGVHALAFGLGVGAGPLAGAALYAVSPMVAFGCGAALLALSQVAVWAVLPACAGDQAMPDFKLWRRVSLPLHAILTYGVAESTLMGLFPIFMLAQGHSVGDMSLAFAAFVLGSLLATLPVTQGGDRIGHARMLGVCAAVGLGACLAMVALPPHSPPWMLGVISCAMGAALGPVYPLALALMGRTLAREQLAGGSALFTVAFSVGSLCAPWLASLAMRRWGDAHLFSLTAALLILLLLRLFLSAPVPTALPATRSTPS
jgi:MFS family permease